jgi:cysteine-rich repeat protein
MRTLLLLCFLSVGCPGGICGNNSLDAGEVCDDGNNLNADGCEANCSLPACQNGIVDPDEVCFFEPVKFETDFSPQEVVAADLNGDGALDLVTTNTAESLSVLLGDGAGDFSRLSDVDVTEGGDGLVVADLDGDNILDLVSSSSIFNKIEVFRGLGDGSFSLLVALSVFDPDSLVVADFNGDQLPDLASTSDTGVAVFRNDGAGGFLAPLFSEAGSRIFELKSGDFNGDSVLDLVALTKDNEDTFLVQLGDGAGNFAVQPPQASGNSSVALLAADVSGDGLLDVSIGHLSGEVSILEGNGAGLFSEAQTLSVFGPVALAAGDLNGDGLLDVAVASDLDFKFSSHLGLLLGGAEDFEVLPLLPASNGNLRGIALADLNKDGAIDAALTDQSNAQVVVFLFEP